MPAEFPFKINGIPLDGSSSFPALKWQGATYSRQAVDSANTGRNQEGDLIRDLITQKDKWKLEFIPCTSTELNALLTTIDGAFFQFTAPNVGSTTTDTKTFYVGDRTATMLKLVLGGESLWDVSFDIIER